MISSVNSGLIKKARRGDGRAFSMLIENHERFVFNVVYRITGNAEDARDVSQEAFIKAFKNTNTIIDKRFKRNISLYRKFGNTQIFRTNLYTISNDKIEFDTSRYVYYLLENNVIYYLGIDLNDKDLNPYLFNK